MKRLFLVLSILTTFWAAPAAARTVEEQILENLAVQGYQIVEHGYTFLGRLRIVAENGIYHREIVVNPGTGEILRDYAITLPQSQAMQRPETSGGGSAKTSVATAADVMAPANSGVAMSLGTIRTYGSDAADIVLPESILQMAPGAF